MQKDKRHILLCGNRRSGRSSMIHALLQRTELPAHGFMTRTMNTRPDGYHEIYMFPWGTQDPIPDERCHIGDCNTRERVIHNEVFNRLGVELVDSAGSGILVMDEIGFMESNADAFCEAVLRRLSGEIPVLASVRTSIETPFLRRVLSSEKARIIEMRPENFNTILEELTPIVAGWAEESAIC